MKEITKRIHKAGLEKLKPLIAQLERESVDQNKIVQTAKRYTESKLNEYYAKRKEATLFNIILDDVVEDASTRSQSSAEFIFFNLLRENNISFKFQYPIGPYTANYLIGQDVVIELDGAQHNKAKDAKRDSYLRKMGYRIIRVPIFILALAPDVVFEQIKNTA